MLTLVLLALAVAVSALHFATTWRPFRTAPVAITQPQRTPMTARPMFGLLFALQHPPDDRPPARPFRVPFQRSDPLAKHRAVTGLNAHVRWYQRFGSLIGIVALVLFMGVLLAAMVGGMFFGARIALEMLVG